MEHRATAFLTVNGALAFKPYIINDDEFYIIDGIPTRIDCVRNNIAKCYVMEDDGVMKPCYVVRYENSYAHGETAKQAFLDAQHKSFMITSIEDRLLEFINTFPTLDTIVENSELFVWHNKLTGSCEFGRKLFVEKFGLSTGVSSVRDFIKMSIGNFGSEIISRLESMYTKSSSQNNMLLNS